MQYAPPVNLDLSLLRTGRAVRIRSITTSILHRTSDTALPAYVLRRRCPCSTHLQSHQPRVVAGGIDDGCVPGSNRCGTGSSRNGCYPHPAIVHSTQSRGRRRSPHAQLLLKKGIITQQDYDQAVTEEQQAEQREQQENAVTKNGLQIKIGGFAELDFIGETTRSFEEITGNRPVRRSDTLAVANGR